MTNSEYFLINPATEEEFGSIQRSSAAELLAVADRCRVAQKLWAARSVEERCAIVSAFCDEFESRAEAIARDVTRQMGKPLAQARNEVNGTLERARSMIEQAPEALAPRLPKTIRNNFERFVERIPHGVVLNMAAWNYPLLIAVNVVVPAVLAGNGVVLKHSARTPLCGDIFAEIFAAVGGPRDLVASVQATHQVMADFIQSGACDYIAFTGSVQGGRQVKIASSDRFVNLGLELGGKDPAYVMDEQDDLDWTAANLAEAFIYNCGQSCCAVERIYVHEKVHDAFLERFLAHAASFTPGDPLLEGTNLGPLVNDGARQHILSQAEDARRRGAAVLLAGGPHSVNDKGFFYKPEVFGGVNHEMSLMREENFGPIMGVMRVTDDAQALELMNDSPFGLTASVWGRDPERIRGMLGHLQAGTVFMNRCDYLDPELTWTGYGDSGLGSTLGHEGFEHLTKPRSVHMRIKAGE